jgi:hypothetical protein
MRFRSTILEEFDRVAVLVSVHISNQGCFLVVVSWQKALDIVPLRIFLVYEARRLRSLKEMERFKYVASLSVSCYTHAPSDGGEKGIILEGRLPVQ